jgi:hypothetical protein
LVRSGTPSKPIGIIEVLVRSGSPTRLVGIMARSGSPSKPIGIVEILVGSGNKLITKIWEICGPPILV